MTDSAVQQERLRMLLSRIVTIPDPAWEAARPLFVSRPFGAAAHLVEAGVSTETLFFLTEGLVRFYYLDAQGREYNKSFAGEGLVVTSVSSLVTGTPSPFFIQALLPVRSLAMGYRDYLGLAESFPAWRQLQLRLLEQLVIKKERREADFLRLPAAERYRQFLREHAAIADAIPNYHIASYLGITEVALSRIRRRLKLTGVNDPVVG
ncbi:Crp/Fnr family transcriptional regulator [Microbulbifer halophilus]|uniref:Crp/Fnr family transcriptional regulator n=1 Tax=Microbulbifer halophilus TaxID=453963 RepID=A0ABW5E8Y9_9GAMM|nr:Crp/Fnr family transcriptional regulator [Microbulbifer halophilus]MCW8127480.1 Crp/Fnr family transcriptional regulator [Microbulbifer halophilus]